MTYRHAAMVFLALALSSITLAEPPEWTPTQKTPTFAFLAVFGQGAPEVADYSGSATVTPGQVVKVEGWHFERTDKITGPDSWQCQAGTTKPKKLSADELARGRKQPEPKPQPIGVLIYVDASPAATATVKIPAGEFQVKLSDLKYGRPRNFLDGLAVAQRVPISDRLTEGPAMHDYPSFAFAPDGSAYVAWLSWEPDADQVLARRWQGGQWGEVLKLSPQPGDNWKTQVAAAGDGSVWVVWPSREGTNWDLWGRRVDGGKLGQLERLTTDPGAEIYQALTADRQGRLWLAWQAARGGQYDIYLKSYENGKWGPEIKVSESPANDWEPSVAADSSGRVYIAWDSYDQGNYDLFLRTLDQGKLSEVRQLTQAPEYEARPSLTVDAQDRLWLAWEQADVLWGKDQGFLVPQRGFSRLRNPRIVRIACLENGQLMQPKRDLFQALPGGVKRANELPRLSVDGQGRLWVLYRRSEAKIGGGNPFTLWHEYAAYWDGQDWQTQIFIPYTVGREDVYPGVVPDPAGGLRLVWASDERPWRNPIPGNYNNPGSNNVYLTTLAADEGTADLPPLQAYEPPTRAETPANLHPSEAADVARRRAARWTVGGREYRLLTGDTHRHTDVSFDGGGDASMYDMMRYEIDAVQQEYIAAWDHDNGGGQDYSWWRSQKLADLFYIEDVFEPLYGYERSVNYPDGHRNVTFAQRGVRDFNRVNIPNPNPNAPRKFILSPDDTKKLYAYLRQNQGICFSHTSATDMGTDWRDNDPELEPDVEIYQGCRTSYEYEGAPKAASADKVELQIGGWRPLGFVWNALAKGYRLGIMASSDHGSTHLSYAGVWVTDFSRQAIFDAFKARHCFGATDNLAVMFGAGEHMMGDEFTAPKGLALQAQIMGTAPLSIVDVIKDNKIVFSQKPQGVTKDLRFTYTDTDPGELDYYYVRAQQTDNQIAWSSPMWIKWQ